MEEEIAIAVIYKDYHNAYVRLTRMFIVRAFCWGDLLLSCLFQTISSQYHNEGIDKICTLTAKLQYYPLLSSCFVLAKYFWNCVAFSLFGTVNKCKLMALIDLVVP